MTLRHQVFLILLFGSRSILTDLLVLDSWLCAAGFSRFCFFGSLAILVY
jgi:hypothetical protein